MIEYDGETYVTATEIARQFKISRGTCYNNLLQQVQKCYLPGRKHTFYKQSEVEQFSEVRIVETSNRSILPAPTNQADTGRELPSNHKSTQWTGTASIAYPVATPQYPTRKEA